jgi:hypothetical protein
MFENFKFKPSNQDQIGFEHTDGYECVFQPILENLFFVKCGD